MTRWYEFGASDWDRIESTWSAWWNGTLERPLVTGFIRDPGTQPPEGDDFLTRFPLDMPAEAIIDHFERRLSTIQFYGDAYPKYWVNFGAGVIAAFLGSGVEYNTGTTWFYPLPGINRLSEMHLRYDPENVWWKRAQTITRAAVERWDGRVLIAYTDVGGNLDILASLRGTQDLLIDCIEEPDEVVRLVSDITELWKRYISEIDALLSPHQRGRAAWAPPWCPSRGYMLQCDFSYMISPEMFGRYVMPDLVACSEWLDYPFYHMDGKGQLVHLDLLLSIEKLRGIQWQPGDGQPRADGWMDVLRRIREGGKLCQVYVTLEGALKIARELGGKGFLFDIVEQVTPQQLDKFYNELERIGV